MTERYSRRHYSVDDRRAIQLVQLRWPASGGPRVPRFSWKTADLGLALRVYIWTERCDHSGPRIPAVRFRSLRPAGPERRDARRPVHMRWATLFVYVSLSLSLSSSISAPVHPRPPISFSRSSLYAPVIQHDGGCVYPALPLLPFLFVFVTLARSLSPLCFLVFLVCFTLSPANRESPLLCRWIVSYRCCFSLARLLYTSLPRFDYGRIEGCEPLSRCFFLRQQRDAYAR